AGWVVLLCTDMNGGHFGQLRVGTIVDSMAKPGLEDAAMKAGAKALLEMGAEMIIANHTHGAWIAALRANGFFPGPSNYVFAGSPPLAKAWLVGDSARAGGFITRGDGDGRIHL